MRCTARGFYLDIVVSNGIRNDLTLRLVTIM